jgi:hypothetical protein
MRAVNSDELVAYLRMYAIGAYQHVTALTLAVGKMNFN